MTYQATATREGKWWVVDVEGVGATQGRSAAEARAMAKDLVATMEEVPIEDVRVDITFTVGDPELRRAVRDAKASAEDAAEKQRKSAEKQRALVRELKSAGLSGSDVAAVLGVSTQRISQLLAAKQSADRQTASRGSSRRSASRERQTAR